jgi:hypothetical protein
MFDPIGAPESSLRWNLFPRAELKLMTREEVRVELKQYSTDHPKLFRGTIREEDNRRRAELELDANGEARQVSEVPEKPSPKWAEVTRTRTRSGYLSCT